MSAIEQYSAKTLRQRAFAFEGTVVGIETRVDPKLPDRDQERSWVTFQVHRWFRGGTGDEVSIWFDVSAGFFNFGGAGFHGRSFCSTSP